MTRPPVTLPLTEARCPDTRAKPCSQAHGCARALVAADQGRPLRDYSAEPRMPGGRCGWFLAIAYAEPAGPAAPRTHDAPEGLC